MVFGFGGVDESVKGCDAHDEEERDPAHGDVFVFEDGAHVDEVPGDGEDHEEDHEGGKGIDEVVGDGTALEYGSSILVEFFVDFVEVGVLLLGGFLLFGFLAHVVVGC